MLTLLALTAASATVLPAGSLQAEVDGRPVALPALKTDVVAHLDGDLATVTLSQTFHNETASPLHARYLFPLPDDAAVTAMTLTTASGRVAAEIRRREEAKQVFEAAKAEGKKAALLDQERPNVFQQQVANLAPGESVQVELTYAHVVPRVDDAYTWTLPLVVGPRYVPPTASDTPDPLGTWTVKSTDLPPNPDHIDPDRVSVQVTLDGGMQVRGVRSTTHPIDVSGAGALRTVHLADGRTLDNRDLVLSYVLAGPTVAAGSTTWAESGRGVVSLLVEPPATADAAQLTPREMVFVVDTSGSMDGVPLEACRVFMRQALDDLRPGDRVRLVSFADVAHTQTASAQPVDRETLAKAHQWVESLRAGGGTNTRAGIEASLGSPIPHGTLRTVVFLTDGYIGNEAEVLGRLRELRGDARLFSFGIGNAVNHYLIEELAREGRGVARVVSTSSASGSSTYRRGGQLDPEEARDAALELAQRLQAPFLTDVTIDWGEAPVRQATPEVLPDVFLGQPLRVLAKYDAPGTFDVTIRGTLAGKPAVLPLRVDLPAEATAHAALPNVWARSLVHDRMIDLLDPSATPETRRQLQEQVTTLGLEYGLITQWTSFVAVAADAPLPSSGPVATADVATPGPLGVGSGAYGGGSTFGGGAAPEPATWLAGLLLAGLGGLSLKRRRGDERC